MPIVVVVHCQSHSTLPFKAIVVMVKLMLLKLAIAVFFTGQKQIPST
jgi:hypothetical protein